MNYGSNGKQVIIIEPMDGTPGKGKAVSNLFHMDTSILNLNGSPDI